MRLNENLQWFGMIFIVLGHTLNSLLEYGYPVRPYNILVFTIGAGLFLVWSLRVSNRQQAIVNVVSIAIGLVGLFKALG
jgi:hypothetical protein